ncbi:MAG TPA: class A beta-lactamase-related serine hydrolase, partial [Bacteroidetes bacterium]|nr:class A beta-lactamase-related serine hydrolase [Bacteroidota bacterium]
MILLKLQITRLLISGMVLISIFFLGAFTRQIYAQNRLESSNSELIKQALIKIVDEGKAPGIIAAIISSDRVLAIGSAGVRKAGTNVAMTDKDLVHIGSCTKAMTSTMIATLVAEGKMSWDMKLTEAIPELKNDMHTYYENTTLWQLLTHRAGIPNDPVDWYAYADKNIKDRRFAILKDNIKLVPAYTDGEFHYS